MTSAPADTLFLDNFNVQAASGYYSQLAGVLAGFVFTAMILLLSNPPKVRGGTAGDGSAVISTPLLAFFVVLFQLIVASFSYAVVTGDSGTPRATVLGLFASCVLAIASAEMFITIAWFFKVYGVSRLVMRICFWLCSGVGFIVLIWLLKTMGDTESVMYRKNWQSEPRSLGWVALLGFLWLAGFVQRSRRPPQGDRGLVPLMVMSLIATLILAVWFGVVADSSTASTNALLTRPMGLTLMAMEGILLMFCQLNIPDYK
jgi:hypothetical protein